MIPYLFKFIVCTGVLYTFYHLVLRNERFFRFNRFFLLSIVMLAAIIPVVTVKTKTVEFTTGQIITPPSTLLTDQAFTANSAAQGLQLPNLTELFIMVYFVVAAFLLLRLVLNLWSLNRLKKGGEIIHHEDIKLVLRSDINQSFSFMRCMFTNKQQYEHGLLPKEVFAHEKAHIHQRHSYDILLIELITCLCWFNPVVYLLKRAIQLNHEFLADEVAISETGSLVQYQNIIIQFASRQVAITPALASHLSFGETKKRIKIMVKTQNKTIALAKQIMAMTVIFFLFVTFGETKIIAQEPAKRVIITAVPFLTISPKEPVEVQDTKKRPEPPMLISSIPRSTSKVRYTDNNGQRITTTFGELKDPVRRDFLELKLDGEVWIAPTEKDHFTQAMLDDFKDAEKYGVWIDGSKVDNSVLNRHKPEDFHHFFKSKLGKGAKNFGQYIYHLNLVTQKTFEKLPSKMNGMWIKYNDQAARARRYLDPVEEKN